MRSWRTFIYGSGNRLHAYQLVGGGLFVFFTLLAVYWPIDLSGDEWLYHFPFAARLWGIAPGTFQLSPETQSRWEGFPKLWEWVQGLFWWASGSLRAAMLPMIGLACVYWRIGWSKLRVPPTLLIIGFLTCPLLMIHYQSFYVDLPTGLCLATAAILLFTTDFAQVRLVSSAALGPVVLLGMAGNIKIQGLIGACAIAFVAAIVRLAHSGVDRGFLRLLAVLGIGMSISTLSYTTNFARTGNPFYPFEINVAGRVLFDGPEQPLSIGEAAPPSYDVRGARYRLPQPLAFALSTTELDWIVRGVAPRYNADSNTGDMPISGSPSRTGGWGQLFVLLNLTILLVQLVRLGQEKNPLQRQLAIGTAGLLILIAFVPRSHELRYWLFLPLLVTPTNLRYLLTFMPANRLGLLMMVPLSYSLMQVALSANSYVLSRPPFVGMRGGPERSPEMLRALRATGRYCASGQLLFRYSQAVTGQPGIFSERMSDCAR